MGGIGRRLGGLLLGVGLLAAGCGGGSAGGGSGSGGGSAAATTAPATTVAAPEKSCLNGGERAISFPAADGPRTGVVLGRGRTGLVLGHQAGSDLCEWLPRARALARQGRQALAFDFGQSGHLEQDMAAAAAELRRRGVTRLVLVGSSMGGTAAIAAAAQINPPVAGVVSLSGPEDYQGTDAAAAAPKLRMPALFVAARDDPPFNDAAKTLYQAVPGPHKRLLLVDGGAHGTSLLEFGDQAPLVRKALDQFLQTTLGDPG